MTSSVTIHPALAKLIARAINDRAVAADMIHTVIARKDFKEEEFLFWRDQHIQADRARSTRWASTSTRMTRT